MPKRKRENLSYSSNKKQRQMPGYRKAYKRKSYGGYKGKRYEPGARSHPYRSFGRQYVPVGSYTDQAGSSWRNATDAQRAWRRTNNYYGKGKYSWKKGFHDLKMFGRTKLGKKLGGWARRGLDTGANMLIPGSGKFADMALKRMGVGMYSGAGIYDGSGIYNGDGGNTVQNDLIEGGSDGVMRFDEQSDVDGIVISHSEYVQDIYGPADATQFSSETFSLNPGISRTFPMLAQLAANYEDCEFVQLAFTFKSTQSDNATSGTNQVGQVVMATQYNPTLEKFHNKATMLNSTGGSSSKTTESQYHGIECDASKLHNDNVFLVRTKPVLTNQNICDFDLGYLQVAITGCPEQLQNATLGELHVSYTVKLTKPRAWTNQGLAMPRDLSIYGGKDDTWNSNYSLAMPCTSQGSTITPSRVSIPVSNSKFTQNLYKAQQQTINTALVQDYRVGKEGGNFSRLIFPAYLSGDFKIRIKAVCNECTVTDSGSGIEKPILLIGEPDFNAPSIANGDDYDYHGLEGNVSFITDLSGPSRSISKGMMKKNDGVNFMPTAIYFDMCEIAENNSGDLTDQALLYSERDVRLRVATDGTDNSVDICVQVPNSLDQTIRQTELQWLEIEVVQINTSLNYSRQGHDDRVILIDNAKQNISYN